MSLLQRKRAKAAAKTNDLSTITWAGMATSMEHIENLVGKNAQIRYGIATETDIGLPVSKHVLVPVLKGWDSEAELINMYHEEVLMCGIHQVITKDNLPVKAPFEPNSAFDTLAAIEWDNRVKSETIKVKPEDDDKYDLAAPIQEDLAATLTAVCAHLNYVQLRSDYADINEGALIAGAHAIAMAYRTGIIESNAGREFLYVHVKVGDDGSYAIVNIDPNYQRRPTPALKVGATFPPGTLQLHPKLVELGLGLCIGAGTTHYMMNHTTGGSVLNGHNLKALAINNLYEVDPPNSKASENRQTEFVYNVVHPVNKRAVANLVLRNSRVNTWYKNAYLLNPTVLYSDTFMNYRQNLVPSGAHKAYIAALVLRDITQAGLGIFLPDQELCRKVIQLYADIQKFGARAHVGSRYYTDMPPAISQSEVDEFLPLAAYYVHFRMANSSIAASPHLSREAAESANPAWKAIVDATVRAGALGAPAEQINAYLQQSGAAGYRIKLDTPEGRRDAIIANSALTEQISKLF